MAAIRTGDFYLDLIQYFIKCKKDVAQNNDIPSPINRT